MEACPSITQCRRPRRRRARAARWAGRFRDALDYPLAVAAAPWTQRTSTPMKKHTSNGISLALALFAVGAASCGSSTTSPYDSYVYYGYYPADLYYSSYYWTDPYSVYYY